MKKLNKIKTENCIYLFLNGGRGRRGEGVVFEKPSASQI
jgi:hypothetical protein